MLTAFIGLVLMWPTAFAANLSAAEAALESDAVTLSVESTPERPLKSSGSKVLTHRPDQTTTVQPKGAPLPVKQVPPQQPDQTGAMAQMADSMRQGLAVGVKETAEWIDSFFADPEYPKEDVDVRLDVRQYYTWLESHPNEHKTRVSAQVRLPNFSESVSITLDGNDDEDERTPSRSITDSIREVEENPNLGLQYLNQVSDEYSQRVKLGYRFSRRTSYLGGRLRKVWPLSEDSRFRVSQRLRWYQRDGWENQTVADYETMLSDDVFFQQRLKVLWQEYLLEERGTGYQLASSLVYPFADDAAIRWNWTSDYQTRPIKDWTSSQLSLSYRRQFWRDWMYLELGPFVRWENQQGWIHDYGFTLTFQFIIEQNPEVD